MLTDADKKVLEKVRLEVAKGADWNIALERIIRNEPRARKTHLRSVLPAILKRDTRKAEEEIAKFFSQCETPLIDDSAPLSFSVYEEGQHIVVVVDRYCFQYRLIEGDVILAHFDSEIPFEKFSDVQSRIVAEAKAVAQEYACRPHRKIQRPE